MTDSKTNKCYVILLTSGEQGKKCLLGYRHFVKKLKMTKNLDDTFSYYRIKNVHVQVFTINDLSSLPLLLFFYHIYVSHQERNITCGII